MNSLLVAEYGQILALLDSYIRNMSNRSILITGATGLIGSYMTDFLLYVNRELGLGIQIFAASTSMSKLKKRFGTNISNLYFIEHDFTTACSDMGHFDYIIHAASPAHPQAYTDNPVSVMKANIIGTVSLLDSIGPKSRFVFVSSDEIYNTAQTPILKTDFNMTDTDNRRLCYPESKRSAETLCISYANLYNLQISIARLCHVYGPTITDENMRADAQFLRRAIGGQDIVLNTYGTQLRSWCYVADAVCGLLYILLETNRPDIYDISNPKSVASIAEYASALAKIAGVNVRFNISNQCASSINTTTDRVIPQPIKLMNRGWSPIYNLSEGLRHTFYIKKCEK